MKEAQIECLIGEYPIHDLNLRLRKGEVAFVPEKGAKRSKDLEHARKLGAVRVRFVERSRVSKNPPKSPPRSPPPPNVRLSRRQARGPAVPQVEVREGISPEQAQAMADKAAQKAAGDAAKMAVDALLPAIHNILASQQGSGDTSDLDNRIEQAVARAMSSVSFVAPVGDTAAPKAKRSSKGPDEPMFIPKDIVAKDDKSELDVSSESSDAGNLDAAAAALKAAKPKRRSRKKSTASKE